MHCVLAVIRLISEMLLQVEDLQKNLVEEQKIVAEKNKNTTKLIEAIGKEKVEVRNSKHRLLVASAYV